jgi:uncharacterized protein involved in exopolysaccharide biosynthesis
MEDNFRILKPFIRGLPIIILVVIISVIGAKKYLSYVTPMYESTAKIKLADIGQGVPNGNLFKDFDVFASSTKIAAEIEVLKSTKLLTKALDSLDFNTEIYRVGSINAVELYNNSPLSVRVLNADGPVYNKRFKLVLKSDKDYDVQNLEGKILVSGKLNEPTSLLGNQLLVEKNQKVISEKKGIKIIDNYEFEFLSKEKLIEKIEKNLDIVSTDKDVPVIRINLKSNVPEKAAMFVNKLSQTYIQDYIDSKYRAANVTVNFLNQQIKEAGEKLAQSENRIEDYRNNNSIINIKQETETDLRKVSQLKIQQTNIKMNLEAIEELNKYIAFGKDNFLALAPNFEAFTDLLSTEIIKNIKKLQADKKDLLLTFTPNDERVLVIDEKLKDLTNYLIESIKNTKVNLQVKYDRLSNDINEAEQVFVTVPEKEKNMMIMTRDFDLLQSSYNFLNEKKIEAEIAQAAKISFHRVLTPAVIAQKPISPNRPIIIILAAILGMIASLVCIYAVHFLKAKVNDNYAIEKNSTIPVAIATPYSKVNIERQFIKNTLQLELKGILNTEKILTITANQSNEGKNYNIVNICKVISKQKRTIIIIDAQGDLEYLKTTQNTHQQLFDTAIEDVFYLDLFSSKYLHYSADRIHQLIISLKDKADFIIINNEFLKEESRALLMMNIADSNLFVVDARRTPLKLISRLELLKAEFAIPNLSFLLNKAGHNPNVVKEVLEWFRKVSQKNK